VLLRLIAENQRSWMSATGHLRDELLILFPETLPGPEALETAAPTVGCWALAPDPRLDAHLRALGFEPGWQPHWMAKPVGAPAQPDPRVSEPAEVPEYDAYGQSLLALTRERPQTSHLFVAREEGRFAGHAWLHVAAGVGGLYDVFVPEDLRRRGIGTALVDAASSKAAALGIDALTLNAEADAFWEAAGFRSLGRGQTWWRHRC
jgi:GNAT superfamily N-acetyltransferase